MGIFLYLCAENNERYGTETDRKRTFTTSPLTLLYRKKIIFIQYNDYIEYFYYLCDVEKEEPAGS